MFLLLASVSIWSTGCTTNNIIDTQARAKIDTLTSEGERLIEEIDEAKLAKQRLIARLQQSLAELEKEIQIEHGERNVKLTQVKEGLKLTILDRVLFDSGSIEVKASGKKILQKLAPTLERTKKQLQITGFTDNKPIVRTKHLYRSNWELSIHRALSVLHFFEQQGIPSDRMFSVGYGENMPVDTNDTKEGRRHNRRVEIILLDNIQRS